MQLFTITLAALVPITIYETQCVNLNIWAPELQIVVEVWLVTMSIQPISSSFLCVANEIKKNIIVY